MKKGLLSLGFGLAVAGAAFALPMLLPYIGITTMPTFLGMSLTGIVAGIGGGFAMMGISNMLKGDEEKLQFAPKI